MSTSKQVVELARRDGARKLDGKFVDPCGTWQPFTCPIRELSEEIFADGPGFQHPRLEARPGRISGKDGAACG